MAPVVNQPSLKPIRKVAGGAVIGIPAGVVLVWVLQNFILPQGTTIPGEVSAAIGSILTFIAAYFVKERA